ncbi:MAG: hypothetical protein ACP5TL_01255 [Candidatus Micrarchaeia archaeon]
MKQKSAKSAKKGYTKRGVGRPKPRAKSLTHFIMGNGTEFIQYGVLPSEPATYSEVMLKNILNKNDTTENNSLSVMLHSASSLTESLRRITYKEGFSTGKSLYRMLNATKHYSMYEESIPDLVSFLESAGLGTMTYSIFESNPSFAIYGAPSIYIGSNIHTFEAGIISGFISTVRHQYIPINETECINNNSNVCKFSASEEPEAGIEMDENESKRILGNVVNNISTSTEGSVSSSFLSLLSNVLTRREYLPEMKGVFSYIGSELGAKIQGKTSSAKMLNFANVLNSIYANKPKVTSIKPVSLILNFDGTRFRSEFVDLSLSFLNGALPRLSGTQEMKAIEINKYDMHKIRIAEQR